MCWHSAGIANSSSQLYSVWASVVRSGGEGLDGRPVHMAPLAGTRHIERNIGKRSATTPPAPAGFSRTTTATILRLAVRPGSSRSRGTATTRCTAAACATSSLTVPGSNATITPTIPAASPGYGQFTGLRARHGIPVLQCASTLPASPTAAPGTPATTARGAYASSTAAYAASQARYCKPHSTQTNRAIRCCFTSIGRQAPVGSGSTTTPGPATTITWNTS